MPLGALGRGAGPPCHKLHDYPSGHLEDRAIEGQQRLELAFIHRYLT